MNELLASSPTKLCLVEFLYLSCEMIKFYFLIESTNECDPISLKGGDPTAGSPTVTLLRLHPSY